MFQDLLSEAFLLICVISGVPLLAMACTGLVISVLQTATQIQEQIISFVAKWIVGIGFLLIAGPWAGTKLNEYLSTMLARLSLIRGM